MSTNVDKRSPICYNYGIDYQRRAPSLGPLPPNRGTELRHRLKTMIDKKRLKRRIYYTDKIYKLLKRDFFDDKKLSKKDALISDRLAIKINELIEELINEE